MDDALDPSLLRGNAVLRHLPVEEVELLTHRLEHLDVDIRHEVYRRGEPLEHVYFPLTAVFSLVARVDGDAVVEAGTIGREGLVGLPAFLGAVTSPHDAFCQVPGTALRLAVPGLREVLADDGALRRQLNRYTQAMIVQLAQNAACNRVHSTEERASRWLLMTQDRVGEETFDLTQEFLAQMLGVRRPTVSLTAGVLQSAGLIKYSRGVITIVDREGLEDAACECYAVVRDEFVRVGGPAPD